MISNNNKYKHLQMVNNYGNEKDWDEHKKNRCHCADQWPNGVSRIFLGRLFFFIIIIIIIII